MEGNESPYLLLTWLQSGSEEMQLSALEQLCLALLQYESNEALVKFYPPSMYVPILSCLCQDFDISFLLLEAIIRTITYYMQAVPHEVINSLVNTKGTLMAICMRLENPNMDVAIESDLTQQIIKLLEELCKRDTKSLSNIGGASYIINFMSKTHHLIHLDTIKSGFYILYKIIDRIDPNDNRLGDWFEFLSKFLKHADNRIVEYSLHCLLAIIKICNEKKVSTDPLGIEKIIDDLLIMIVLQLEIDNVNSNEPSNRNDSLLPSSNNKIGLSRTIIDLILCIIRSSTQFLCNLLINNKLSGILLEIISQFDGASISIIQLIEGIYDQIYERISYRSDEYLNSSKTNAQPGFRMMHGRIYSDEMFQQHIRYHDCLMKAICTGNLDALKELLLSTDFDPKYKDKLGQTPLNWASALGFTDGVALLSARGIDATMGERASSFHYAASQGHINVIDTLLKNEGLDFYMKDSEGYTIVDRMKQFLNSASNPDKILLTENLISKIEKQHSEICKDVLIAKEYFVRRMIPVIITIYFKNYKNSIRFLVLELLNKITRSFNDTDHDSLIQEHFQNDLLPYHMSRIIYRVLLQDTGENVLEGLNLSRNLIMDMNHSKIYLNWLSRMGVKDILSKTIEKYSSILSSNEFSNQDKIIPLTVDPDYSEYKIVVNNRFNCINPNQLYYWGDWNIITSDDGINLYNEYCYASIKNNTSTQCFSIIILIRKGIDIENIRDLPKKYIKNQLFNNFSKIINLKCSPEENVLAAVPEQNLENSVNSESDYEALEISDKNIQNRSDLVKEMLERYTSIIESLHLISMPVPFPKLVPGKVINIQCLVISTYSNHLKIHVENAPDSSIMMMSKEKQKTEIPDLVSSDETVFIEISINKIAGFVLRSVNQIIYKTGPLNRQGGYKRLEPLKTNTEKTKSLRINLQNNPIRDSICYRIIVNAKLQLEQLEGLPDIPNKLTKNVSFLLNAVNNQKSIEKYMVIISKMISSDTMKPTPYELYKSQFLSVLLKLFKHPEYVDLFVSIFQENLPKLTKMIVQLLEQIENLPTLYQLHSYISDHYLTRALHMRAVLRNCNDHERMDMDPIPDLSKYNFLVMPLSSPINVKKSICNLLQKLPWYRADKMSFNSIRQLLCKPYFVDIKDEESEFRGGIFQWLGTNGFRTRFMNPLKLNLLSVSISENSTNIFSNLYNLFQYRNDFNRMQPNNNHVSVQGPGSFLTIELKHPIGLIPTKYSLGKPASDEADSFCLLNWDLMASVDGINWDVLSSHQNDRSLIDSSNGKYTWQLGIDSLTLNNVSNQGWTIFKIQQLLPKSQNNVLNDERNIDCEYKSMSPDTKNQLDRGGFWLNYIEFYGTVYAISDARQKEINKSIEDYLAKFKVGTLVQLVPDFQFVDNKNDEVGKIMSVIKNGTVLVEWDKAAGKSHMRHKMGAQGMYELKLSNIANESLLENNDCRPKTFTESFIESKSSFEIHPESREDVRNSFQDSISWIIDPNISVPMRTSSLSSQKNNRFPSFFNKENLVETMANKDIQKAYKKRRDAIDDYQEYNTLVKSETEDMDLRYETSDEENFHMESTTIRSYIQSRMEYLDGFSGSSKPKIQVSGKYPSDVVGNLDEKQRELSKIPEELKKNFSLSKQIKRKGSIVLSDEKRETLKVRDNVDDIDISDDSEYFEISQDPEKFLRHISKHQNYNDVVKTKPILEKKYYSSFTKNQKYKQNFTGLGESNGKFKPVNIQHFFPGIVQPIDPKYSQNLGEIRSNIEVINYRQNKGPSKTEEITKSKSFGYNPKQFRLKLEIEVPVPIKSHFNFQKITPFHTEDCESEEDCVNMRQKNRKQTLDFVLNTESHQPIVNYILSMLPTIDPIINTYPIESVSQSWHSQLTLFYGFCDKKINGSNCKNCFFQKKTIQKPKMTAKTETQTEINTIINVINGLKKIQIDTNKKTNTQNFLNDINDYHGHLQWNDSCFVSSHICKMIMNQLEDVWGLLSKDTLPQWIIEWPQKYPFLFSYDMRVEILNAYWFGTSRSIYWLQQRSKTGLDNIRPTFREDIQSPFHFLGRLKKHIAHVPRPIYFGNTDVTETESRSTFWLTVKDLFLYHSRNKEELEIQFEHEVGTGLGPTLEFMNILSTEFMRIDTFMWIHNDTNATDSNEYVHSDNGLFPYPWPADKLNEDILERFHILGIFIAKCLQDNRRIDIPFSEIFLKLLIGDIPEYNVTTYLEDFACAYPMRGKFLKLLSKFCDEKQKLIIGNNKSENTIEDYEDQLHVLAVEILGSTLDSLCIDMEFLSTTKAYSMESYPLFKTAKDNSDANPGGRNAFNESVSEYNVERYLDGTLNFTMNQGIRQQINTMKDGFNEVFPIKSLGMFSASELKQLLCGEQEIKWTLEELYQFTEPTQGYTKYSKNYVYFVEVLEEMTQTERKMFIQFITGCTSLPPGGLKNLKPRLTVVKKNIIDGGPYPSVNTCMHYLKLPEYVSKGELKSKLMDASSQHGFHLN